MTSTMLSICFVAVFIVHMVVAPAPEGYGEHGAMKPAHNTSL